MKWIVISHYGLTKRDIASRRIVSLCNNLAIENEDVILFTWHSSYDSEELYETDRRVKVITIPCTRLPFASGLRRKGIELMRGAALPSGKINRKKKSSFKDWAKALLKTAIANPYNTVFESLINREFLKINSKRYLNALSQSIIECVNEDERTVILSSSGPPIMHTIGHRIKRKYPNVFWIADYRDQITGSPILRASHKMRKANDQAIKKADMITAVSVGLVNDIAKYSPIGEEAVLTKAHILYNGFVSKSSVKACSPTANNQRIRITYTGILYAMRRIDVLIRAMKKASSSLLKSFELLYCGASSSIVDRIVAEEAANSLVTNKGFVSKQEAEKEQDEADILLLLKSNEPESGGMTGKFFEYLERDKPILVLGDSDPEFNEIARKIGGIYVLPYNEERIKEVLIDFSKTWPFEIERNIEEVDKFNWNNLAKGLIEEVERRSKKR